jgi:hypothetical protein
VHFVGLYCVIIQYDCFLTISVAPKGPPSSVETHIESGHDKSEISMDGHRQLSANV